MAVLFQGSTENGESGNEVALRKAPGCSSRVRSFAGKRNRPGTSLSVCARAIWARHQSNVLMARGSSRSNEAYLRARESLPNGVEHGRRIDAPIGIASNATITLLLGLKHRDELLLRDRKVPAQAIKHVIHIHSLIDRPVSVELAVGEVRVG